MCNSMMQCKQPEQNGGNPPLVSALRNSASTQFTEGARSSNDAMLQSDSRMMENGMPENMDMYDESKMLVTNPSGCVSALIKQANSLMSDVDFTWFPAFSHVELNENRHTSFALSLDNVNHSDTIANDSISFEQKLFENEHSPLSCKSLEINRKKSKLKKQQKTTTSALKSSDQIAITEFESESNVSRCISDAHLSETSTEFKQLILVLRGMTQSTKIKLVTRFIYENFTNWQFGHCY